MADADENKNEVSMPSTLTGGVRFTIIILIAIILAAVFGVSIYPTESLHTYLPAAKLPHALFVCPLAAPEWEQISQIMLTYKKQISMVVAALVMFAFFTAMWNLYQNLLKDELDTKSWQFFLKFLFPVLVIIIIAWQILTWTPNHFREVAVSGAKGRFVLCEDSQPGSRPVLYNKVSLPRRINP
jgi:hypothetical protein